MHLPELTKNDHRQRGVALVLVMACVAAAVILGLAFITTSAIGSSSANTAADYYRARHIAESGLAMVVRYADANPTWRDARTNGSWVNNYGLYSGNLDVEASFTSDLRDPLYVTVTGTYGNARHKLEGRLVTTGHVWGAAVKESVTVRNQAHIDAYDSSQGAYGAANVSSDAAVTTNATYAGAVTLQNYGYIKGNVWVGAGGSPSTVVSQSSTATVTGTVGTLAANLVFPTAATMPTDTGPNLGPKTFILPAVINSNKQYDSLTIDVSAIIRITGDVTIRVNGDLAIKGLSTVTIDPGSKLTLYVGGAMNFADQTQVNHTGDTARLLIHGLGSGYTHTIQNQVYVCAAIVAPDSSLSVTNRANFYGVFVGKSLNVSDQAYMHVDRNPALLASDLRLPVFPTGTDLRQVAEK